jgi:hypothetical protein
MSTMIQSTGNMLEFANALSIAIQMHMMSLEQASFVWKKQLSDCGVLPVKEKIVAVKKAAK